MNNTTKVGIGTGIAAAFAAIINSVIFVEGGYSDHELDPGGKTMYGVTEKVARQHGYLGPMEELTKEQAAEIYSESYIVKPGFDKIIVLSQAVGHKAVDAGVNVGPSRSVAWLQTSLNSLNRNGKDYKDLKVDGILGTATQNAYSSLQKARGKVEACKLVIKLMDAQQAAYYISLKNMKEFTVGWISHRIGNIPLEECNNDIIK